MAITRFSTGFPSLFDRFFDSDWIEGANADYSPGNANLPLANIKESADEYVIEVAAPGMKKSDFKVQYDSGKSHCQNVKKSSQNLEERYQFCRKKTGRCPL